MTFVSCNNDDPNDSDGQETSLVTIDDLARNWTLVKDNVKYSEVDASKSDKIIDYSATSSPRYRFFLVEATSESTMTWQEQTASGSSVGKSITLTLNGNNLVDEKGNIAGVVEDYNPAHSWNNLRILWKPNSSMNSYGAPCVSSYMKY